MLYRGVPVPVLIALCILIIGGILHIIGLATPFWHEATLTTSIIKDISYSHHGIWVNCLYKTSDVADCQEHAEGPEVDGYIVAVRALVVLALIFGVTCVVITGLWFFLGIKKHRLMLMITSLGSGFASGLLGLIGIIVYAAEINSKTSTTPGILFSYNLSWSYALCVLSSCMVIIATILIAVGTRMEK